MRIKGQTERQKERQEEIPCIYSKINGIKDFFFDR